METFLNHLFVGRCFVCLFVFLPSLSYVQKFRCNKVTKKLPTIRSLPFQWFWGLWKKAVFNDMAVKLQQGILANIFSPVVNQNVVGCGNHWKLRKWTTTKAHFELPTSCILKEKSYVYGDQFLSPQGKYFSSEIRPRCWIYLLVSLKGTWLMPKQKIWSRKKNKARCNHSYYCGMVVMVCETEFLYITYDEEGGKKGGWRKW